MKKIYLDIMEQDRFVCQIPYWYNPLFPVDTEDVAEAVFQRYSYLRGHEISIAFSNERV